MLRCRGRLLLPLGKRRVVGDHGEERCEEGEIGQGAKDGRSVVMSKGSELHSAVYDKTPFIRRFVPGLILLVICFAHRRLHVATLL